MASIVNFAVEAYFAGTPDITLVIWVNHDNDSNFLFAFFVLWSCICLRSFGTSQFPLWMFGFLLEWRFSFWLLWKYGELYYKNNRKLPIAGQIKLILIFSSSEIEFLFVILYLLLDFYKHVRQKCVEKWNLLHI